MFIGKNALCTLLQKLTQSVKERVRLEKCPNCWSLIELPNLAVVLESIRLLAEMNLLLEGRLASNQ